MMRRFRPSVKGLLMGGGAVSVPPATPPAIVYINDFETGDLTLADGNVSVGDGQILEAQIAAAYAGVYGLRASTLSYDMPKVAVYHLVTFPTSGHLWFEVTARINSGAENYAAFLTLDNGSSSYPIACITHGPENMFMELRNAGGALEQSDHWAYPDTEFHTYLFHLDRGAATDTLTVWIDGVQAATMTTTRSAQAIQRLYAGIMGTWGTKEMDVDLDNIGVWSANPYETSVFFQHHSTGRNLIADGGMVALLQAGDCNLWSYDYNTILVKFNGVDQAGRYPQVPSDDTDYPNWPTILSDATWLADALTHQVIMLKACFPNSNITTDEQLANDQTYIASVRAVADANPTKLFVIFTQPPLNWAATTLAIAARARALANWMVASLSQGRSNLLVFDFFDELAISTPADPHLNMLQQAYGGDIGDGHPNALANATVAPVFVTWLLAAIGTFF